MTWRSVLGSKDRMSIEQMGTPWLPDIEAERLRFLTTVAMLDTADELYPAVPWLTEKFGPGPWDKYLLRSWAEELKTNGLLNVYDLSEIGHLFVHGLYF